MAQEILKRQIDLKMLHLVQSSNLKSARLHAAMRVKWTQDHDHDKNDRVDLKTLKKELMWDDTKDGQVSEWKDRFDISVLWFAVSMNRLKAVKQILDSYKGSDLGELLSHRLPKDGFVHFGLAVCSHWTSYVTSVTSYSTLLLTLLKRSDIEHSHTHTSTGRLYMLDDSNEHSIT
jgi:hypothetical protein